MRTSRDSSWRPLTIVIETAEEAEILHKVLGAVNDETEEQFLYSLFVALGIGIGDTGVTVSGNLTVE